jgi:hypothetical protein
MILATALLAALLSNPFAPKPKAPATAAPPAVTAPAPVVDVPPRGFPGYAHPDVTAAMCRVINTAQTQCILPAMTAGRYVIEAVGVSTAVTPLPPAAPAPAVRGAAAPAKPQGAAQALTIVAGDRVCGRAESPTWTSGVHALRFNCEIAIVSDTPFAITVVYADVNATKDARGPGLSIRRLPWDGVLSARPFVPQQ